MARYRGRHRAPSTTGRTIARTAVAGAVAGAPLLAAPAASADTTSAWDRLAQCESSGDWTINSGNGFQGGLQFTVGTWHAFGGSGVAHQASREQQIAVAERVLAKQGWGAWPACSRKLGLHGTPDSIGVAPQARPSTRITAAPDVPAPRSADAPSGRTVRVSPGDTLSHIASANGVTGGWQALRAANPALGNPNHLSIGTLLQLP